MNYLQKSNCLTSLQAFTKKTSSSSIFLLQQNATKRLFFTVQRVQKQQKGISYIQKNHFSTKNLENNAFPNEDVQQNEPSMTLEEMLNKIDMEALRQFNPKLHAQIEKNPEILLDLQQVVQYHEAHAEASALQESMNAAAEAATAANTKQPKVFSLPFIWGFGAPVFNATAAALISIQAGTSIPWFPFIVICGFGVRLIMAPMLIRQMTLINKISYASPNIRLTWKLMNHSKLPIYKRAWYGVRAVLDLTKQTKTNLLSFYFYNLIQLPVFIIMVLSIRQICTENTDLSDKGILWFKNLNEPDAYLILPVFAVMINYFNLGRGITKENEHWYINRFRSFFQVIQFFHLPFTYQWPSGAFVYWISSSLFMTMQQTITRKQWFISRVNPNFFYDFQKMYGERSTKDHENYVDRMMNSEDNRLKGFTNDKYVHEELESELAKFLEFQRKKQLIDKANALRDRTK